MVLGEFAQDVPEPAVHLFQDGHVLFYGLALQAAQRRHGGIHPGVTG
jgi:hypothetical protein